jgi:protein-tyrosine-phosphatase
MIVLLVLYLNLRFIVFFHCLFSMNLEQTDVILRKAIMDLAKRFFRIQHDDFIWFLGFGYFFFYAPYGALTKATTKGLIPGVEAVSGTVILPVSAMATLVAMYLFVTLRGWWKHAGSTKVLGFRIPWPRKTTLISGVATAVIIGTTTMAFSFDGVSIVFTLVLMRGGVLLIARITDAISQRKVAWYSMVGMLLTLAALLVLFSEKGGVVITLAAAINLSLYLSGYIVRFQVMRKLSKTRDTEARMRYFVEEQMVAMPALVIGLALMALFIRDPLTVGLREGFLTIWSSSALIPAVLIGIGYGCLYIFGTMIYLDRREYTFCVPVNRASSILSGVVATYALHYLVAYPSPSIYQLGGASLLISAIMVLAIPGMVQKAQAGEMPRLFLFVCNGNRLRSPMAQAICRSYLSDFLGLSQAQLEQHGIRVESAGIEVVPGSKMKDLALPALDQVGAVAHDHSAQQLTTDLLKRAEAVYCMTAEQHQTLCEMLPEASDKVHKLDPTKDIDEPMDATGVLGYAQKVSRLIQQNFARYSF